MAEDLEALWQQAKPIKPSEDLDALWEQAKPVNVRPEEVHPVVAAGLHLAKGASLGLLEKGGSAVDATLDKLQGQPGTWGERYDANLERNRAILDANKAAHPGLSTGAEIVGSIAAPIPGGAAAKGLGYGARVGRAALQGAGMGAAYGYGTSRAKDAAGTVADTALGGVAGGFGGAAGEGVIAPVISATGRVLSPAMEWLKRRAERGLAGARDMARGITQREEVKNIGNLSGHFGSEVQQGNRLRENIRRIEISPDAVAQQSPTRLRMAAELARGKADELTSEAQAMGVPEDGIARIGEFLSAGSKLDKAQRASGQAQFSRGAAERFDKAAEALEQGGAAPSRAELNQVAALRQRMIDDPTFNMDEARLLKRSLELWPEQAARMDAAEGALRLAQETAPTRMAQREADLLSGRAALKRGGELALRYGLPALGGYLGSEYGTPGLLVGAAAGKMAGVGAERTIGALAGGGLRPALQSIYRSATQYPAVKNAWWGTVKKLVSTNPQALGKYAPALTSAAARGEHALAAASFVLSQTDQAFRKMLSDVEDGQQPVASGL